MIKVLICDGDGTLLIPNPTFEIRRMLSVINELDIDLAVASNEQNRTIVENKFKAAKLPIPKVIITIAETQTKKPSPQFIYKIRDETGVSLSEIIYLGDNDETDIYCAINAKVLPFAAKYTDEGKSMKYGLPVNDPQSLMDYLSTYAKQKAPYFGWTFHGICSDTNTPIDVRALFGQHRELGLTDKLKQVLKEQQDVFIGSRQNHMGNILYHYTISQTYLSGLIQDIDTVTVYPGHTPNALNPILTDFSNDFRKVFKQRFMPELLVRHSEAEDSRRTPGANRNIYEQFRTILVNPEYKRKILGTTVLVIDDFTTSGCSLETARRMLLQAGAEKVVGLAVAKWGFNYVITTIKQGWNPFEPCSLKPEDIVTQRLNGDFHPEADEYFHNNIWALYSR